MQQNRDDVPRLFAQTNRQVAVGLFPTALNLVVGNAEEDEQDATPLDERRRKGQPGRS